MILSPLLLAVILSDVVGLLFLAAAVVQTFDVLENWQPAGSTARQLTLERRVEMAGLYGHLALGGFAVGGLLLLVAICHSLPVVVPGAMCGTGVLQAAGTPGWRALVFRCLALLLLGVAGLINGLNQATPTAPLAPPLTRTLLLALPICGLTLYDTARAFLVLDTHAPVSCCAVIYTQVASTTDKASLISLPAPFLVGCLALLSTLILALLFNPRIKAAARGLLILAAVALWLPLAGTVLLTCFAAYHFEVLAHRCPWCLFLPEHRLVGYPLLATFLVMGMEAPVPWLLQRLSRHYPDCEAAAELRLRKVGVRIVLAMAVFWTVGGLPALIWRLRYGVWLG
jgi:hypothetical protein